MPEEKYVKVVEWMDLKCVNCQGEHLADSRFCEAWKKEKD